jgi:hypothetical protein
MSVPVVTVPTWKTSRSSPSRHRIRGARAPDDRADRPEHDYEPEVCLGPDELGPARFLELAAELGGGVLYLRVAPFDPGADDSDLPEDLIRHKGETGQVSVAFAANGVVHFREHHTACYLEWRNWPTAR